MLLHLFRGSKCDAGASFPLHIGWCSRYSVSGSLSNGAILGAGAGNRPVGYRHRPRTQVFHFSQQQQGYGANGLLLGCDENTCFSLPFHGGHGRAKRALVSVCADDCLPVVGGGSWLLRSDRAFFSVQGSCRTTVRVGGAPKAASWLIETGTEYC